MATQRKPPPIPNDIIVFGLDETGRPHAARFPGFNASLVEKLAESLKLRLLKAETEAQKAVAKKTAARQVTRGW